MLGRVEVIGVHPVPAEKPVHLIEIEVEQSGERFDFGDVTQEVSDQPHENWQVAYDERELKSSDGKSRFAFFFHHLDLEKALITSFGSVKLPPVTPVPSHLNEVEYEAP